MILTVGPGLAWAQDCSPQAVPYFEDFNAVTTPALPACMSIETVSGNPWTTAAAPAYMTGNAARVTWTPSGSPDMNSWLFTRALSLTGGTSYRLTYKYGNTSTTYTEALSVAYGTTANETGMTTQLADHPAITGNIPNTNVVNFTPPSTGTYYVGFKCHSIANQLNLFLDDIKVQVEPTCEEISGLTVAPTGTGLATLSWTASTSLPANGYQWEVRSSGAPGSGATGLADSGNTPAGTTTATANGLAANTNYSVYVRASCGADDFSLWSQPTVFVTPCGALDVPYLEDFNSVTVPALPNCMSIQTVSGLPWVTANAVGTMTGKAAKVGYTPSGSPNMDSWLFTGGLNLVAGTSYQLSFKYTGNSSTYTEALKVAYGASPTATGMTNDILDFPAITGTTVQSAEIDFEPAASGVYYIGFQCHSIANQLSLYVDDIKVVVTPTCFPPDAVYLSNGTQTSIELTWLNSNASGYNYEVRTSGAPGSGPTGLAFSGSAASGNTPILISPLTSGTSYTVYVQGTCNGGADQSEWTAGTHFTPGVVEIGSGTTTMGNLPISSCYAYSYGQQIYLANEFTGQPYVNKIAFKYTGGSATPANWNEWTVYMGNTQKSAFADNSDWVPLNALELVYNGPVTPVAGEWMEITLDPGFQWDGTSNIVIAVDENVTGLSCTAQWASFPAENRGMVYQSDSNNPNPASPPTASSRYNTIPQVQLFTGDPPACLSPTGVSVSGITATGATLTWTASTSGPTGGYNWELRETGDAGSGTTGLADSGSTPASITTVTTNLLQPNTTYRLYVQSNCGTGDGLSTWTSAYTFTTPCTATDIPYFEGFTDVTIPNIPSCMSRQTISGLPWQTAAGVGGMTGNAAKISYTPSGSPSMNSWLFTQGLNLAVGNSYRLTFKYTGNSTTYHESMSVSLGTEAAENGMDTQLLDFPSINGTAVQNAQVDFTVPTSDIYYIGFKCYSIANQLSIYLDDIEVVVLVNCTGAPDPGATTGPASVCPGAPFTLGFANDPGGIGGLSYQWQTSSDGTNWADATGSTGETYATSQTATTWYRVAVTCVDGTTTNSAPLQVTMKTPMECMCIPTGAGNNSDEIRNFTLANLNNNSAASEGTNGYMDYTGTVAPAQLTVGDSYTASLTSGSGSGSHGAAIWIDYNDNGVFEATEKVAYTGLTIAPSTTINFPPFTVADAPGTHRLRVQYRFNQNGADLDPCVVSTYSETEDYLVEVSTGTPTEDCLGVVGGPALPGTPCISPNGYGGLWSSNCICIENVGIEEIAANNGLALHPNPASTILYITTPDGMPVHVRVFDMLGKLALENQRTTSLNVATLAPGSYNVLILDDKGLTKARARFVRQ